MLIRPIGYSELRTICKMAPGGDGVFAKKLYVFTFLFVLFLTSACGPVVLNKSAPDATNALETPQPVVTAASYTPRMPIVISSDADFVSQGWPGNGTESDPYMIQGLNITDAGECISISNIGVYFEIRNCIISSGTQSYFDGIVLSHLTHGTVRDCVIDRHSEGICLTSTTDCTLMNNTATNNMVYGFDLSLSEGCTLTKNTATNNLGHGFFLYYVRGTLENNTATSNSASGFVLYFSDGCTLENNRATGQSSGFYIFCSNGCTMTNNTATNNSGAGFHLYSSNGCTLRNNTLANNGLFISGLTPSLSDWFHAVADNTVNGKPLGYLANLTSTVIDGSLYGQVILANCFGVTVKNGVFINVSVGVALGFCTSCTLVNNTATNNSVYGFDLSSSNGTALTSNVATRDRSSGFNLDSSYGCMLRNNTASGNSLFGFYLASSNGCMLRNNTASGNSLFGFYLASSKGCMLKNNTLAGNGLYMDGWTLSDWLHDVSGNTVNGKPIGYFANITSTAMDVSQYGQVILANCFGVTVKNGVFINASVGVELGFCTSCTLMNNMATRNAGAGFYLYSVKGCTLISNRAIKNAEDGFLVCSSDSCTLRNNTATNNSRSGFGLFGSDGCTLVSNRATNNSENGIHLYIGSQRNRAYLNRLGSNHESNARDDGNSNWWDDGVSLGNYWTDYAGSGTYFIPGRAGSIDHYPLMWNAADITPPDTTTTTWTIIEIAALATVVVLVVLILRLRKKS